MKTGISQSGNTTRNLNSVYFTDNQTGWTVGWDGTILKTTNGGENWVSQSIGAGMLSSVYFTDNQTGWVTMNATILTTTNGGESWNSQSSGTVNGLTVSSLHRQSNWLGCRL